MNTGLYLSRFDKQVKHITDRQIKQTINAGLILAEVTGYRHLEIVNAVVSTKWDDDVCKRYRKEVINNFYGLAMMYCQHLSVLMHGLTFTPKVSIAKRKLAQMHGSIDQIARRHLKFTTSYELRQWSAAYYQITDRFPDDQPEPWFIQFIYMSHIMNIVWRLETCMKIVSKTGDGALTEDLTLARSLLQPLLVCLPLDSLPRLPNHD